MSSVAAIEISYYMKIAIDINKKVGGTRAYEAQSNAQDRFFVIKDIINKSFHYVKSKLDQRQRRKGDPHQINNDIQEAIDQIYRQLQRMREAVASDKTANKGTITIKNDIIQKLQSQTRELQDLIDNQTALQKKIFRKEREQTQTQKREALLKGANPGRFQSKVNYTQGPTEIQLQKMQDWKTKDEEIDEGIGEILQGIKRWKQGLKMTGQLIDESDKKILNLTANVQTVNESLFQSNKQLKGIVQKLRKPHKFCIDIVLVLILIALVVGIIKLSGG